MSAPYIPFGANPEGFVLRADMRMVAAHYALGDWRQLLRADGRSPERIACAFDALIWWLLNERRLSQAAVCALLKTTDKTVREAATRHQHRINEHRITYLRLPPLEGAHATS